MNSNLVLRALQSRVDQEMAKSHVSFRLPRVFLGECIIARVDSLSFVMCSGIWANYQVCWEIKEKKIPDMFADNNYFPAAKKIIWFISVLGGVWNCNSL